MIWSLITCLKCQHLLIPPLHSSPPGRVIWLKMGKWDCKLDRTGTLMTSRLGTQLINQSRAHSDNQHWQQSLQQLQLSAAPRLLRRHLDTETHRPPSTPLHHFGLIYSYIIDFYVHTKESSLYRDNARTTHKSHFCCLMKYFCCVGQYFFKLHPILCLIWPHFLDLHHTDLVRLYVFSLSNSLHVYLKFP